GQLIVPNYATDTQLANIGEGIFSAPSRHQIVFGASEFPPYPIVISQIQWRPDSADGGPFSNTVVTNIQINLSTTAKSADALDSTFSQNIGADDSVVFSGTLTLSTAFTNLTNNTKAFDMNAPLQTPFTYNPANGNLLLDVRDFTGCGVNLFDNATASGTDTVSRVSTTDPNGTSGVPDSAGGAIQITYTPLAMAP